MDRTIPVPRHLTAHLQHLLRLVACGHHYWTADRITVAHLPRLVAKWAHPLRLRADAPARAYAKRVGIASVHLCLSPDLADPTTQETRWWMLATAGREGLLGAARTPGPVQDCRHLDGRLRCGDYELLQATREYRQGHKAKTATTWTWRLTPSRYREWEALLVEQALQGNRASVAGTLDCLAAMPLFAGIRDQVQRLAREANKVLGKVRQPPIATPDLPTMRMVRLWHPDLAY